MNNLDEVLKAYRYYQLMTYAQEMLIEELNDPAFTDVSPEGAQAIRKAGNEGLLGDLSDWVLQLACDHYQIENTSDMYRALCFSLIDELYRKQPKPGRPSAWPEWRLQRLRKAVDAIVKEKGVSTLEACQQLEKTDEWTIEKSEFHPGKADAAETLRRYYQRAVKMQTQWLKDAFMPFLNEHHSERKE